MSPVRLIDERGILLRDRFDGMGNQSQIPGK